MPVFTAPDGVSLSYEVWPGTSELPLVLLHHGFIADGESNWVAPGIVAALTAAGRRVATIDARGHGRSDKPHDPARYGEARMAEDVRALVDLLGEASYDLAGYSMGAIVSLLTAVRDPRVRRLVVGGVGAAVVELGGVDTRAVGRPALLHALGTDDPATVTDPAAAGFRAFVDAVGGDRKALAAQVSAAHDRPIPLDTVKAPTLVLAGRDDPLAVRPQTLADALPDARLRLVPGDHMQAVRDPAFRDELVRFLGTG
ncbi:alpha/beta fold hydrolase [Streptomyces sp. NPDC005551]|uniref:alpha/beta fold hydrolase n=1 Tax=unclassified Streptomyces TaxID=2593676 RepID=UPI0033FEC1EC